MSTSSVWEIIEDYVKHFDVNNKNIRCKLTVLAILERPLYIEFSYQQNLVFFS